MSRLEVHRSFRQTRLTQEPRLELHRLLFWSQSVQLLDISQLICLLWVSKSTGPSPSMTAALLPVWLQEKKKKVLCILHRLLLRFDPSTGLQPQVASLVAHYPPTGQQAPVWPVHLLCRALGSAGGSGLVCAPIWPQKIWAAFPLGLSALFCLLSCFKAADNHKCIFRTGSVSVSLL